MRVAVSNLAPIRTLTSNVFRPRIFASIEITVGPGDKSVGTGRNVDDDFLAICHDTLLCVMEAVFVFGGIIVALSAGSPLRSTIRPCHAESLASS